jgi:cytochrome b pre-mRNA-processing protein 3
MLRFLFRRLTGEPRRGQALFDRVVADARQPHWYIEGEVADSIDGRFAVLATVCALYIVAVEDGSPAGDSASAALTERFIEAMDSEHRELGLNDPGLGRRVRKLVGALERRVDELRDALHGESDWGEAVISALHRGEAPRDAALAHSSRALRELSRRLSEERLAEAAGS